MVKFNDDELISALLIAGFDKVDLFLLKKVKEEILKSGEFFCEKLPPSENFMRIVRYHDGCYEPIASSVFDVVYRNSDRTYLVADGLPQNKELIKFVIKNVDYKDIIEKKSSMFLSRGKDDAFSRFSYKELIMLNKLFGITIKSEVLRDREEPLFLDLNDLSQKELQRFITEYYNTFLVELLDKEHVDIIKRESSIKTLCMPEKIIELPKKEETIEDDEYEDCVLIQHYNEMVALSRSMKGDSIV